MFVPFDSLLQNNKENNAKGRDQRLVCYILRQMHISIRSVVDVSSKVNTALISATRHYRRRIEEASEITRSREDLYYPIGSTGVEAKFPVSTE